MLGFGASGASSAGVKTLKSGVDADAGKGRDCDGEKRRAVTPPSIQAERGRRRQ